MSQPAKKVGPVSPGAQAVFGSSAQGLAQRLSSIQQSARGVGEWIDGLATGAEPAPAVAHDHRGGVYGRPLGVGHSVPVRLSGQLINDFAFEAFLNVPDPRAQTGEELPDVTANGGYTFVDLHAYTFGQLLDYFVELEVWRWSGSRWAARQVQVVEVKAPGAGGVWKKAEQALSLPPGLVRVAGRNLTNTVELQWLSFVVPQR